MILTNLIPHNLRILSLKILVLADSFFVVWFFLKFLCKLSTFNFSPILSPTFIIWTNLNRHNLQGSFFKSFSFWGGNIFFNYEHFNIFFSKIFFPFNRTWSFIWAKLRHIAQWCFCQAWLKLVQQLLRKRRTYEKFTTNKELEKDRQWTRFYQKRLLEPLALNNYIVCSQTSLKFM